MTTAAPAIKTSRVGKRPVALPKGVTVKVENGAVQVKGPKAELTHALERQVDVKVDDSGVVVTSTAVGRDASRLQGLRMIDE